MFSLFSTVKNAVVNTLVDRTPLGDLKGHWMAAQRALTKAQESGESTELFHRELLAELHAAADILEQERDSGTATTPCRDYFLREQVALKTCTYIKQPEPLGARPLFLAFLRRVLSSLAKHPEHCLTLDELVVPLLDMLNRTRHDILAVATEELHMDDCETRNKLEYAAMLEWISEEAANFPLVWNALCGYSEMFPRSTVNSCWLVDAIVSCLESCQDLPVKAAVSYVERCYGALSALRLVSHDRLIASLLAEDEHKGLRRATALALKDVCRAMVSFCRMPENIDAVEHAALVVATARFLDETCAFAPSHFRKRLVEKINQELFGDTLLLFLASETDRVFVCSATVLSFLTRSVGSCEALEFALGNFIASHISTVLRRCNDLSETASTAALDLLGRWAAQCPILASKTLFPDRAAPSSGELSVPRPPIDIDMLFADDARRTCVCTDTPERFQREAAARVVRRTSFGAVNQTGDIFIQGISTSNVAVMLTKRAASMMSRGPQHNAALTGAILAVVSLDSTVFRSLLDPSRGPVALALASVARQVGDVLKDRTTLELYKQFVALDFEDGIDAQFEGGRGEAGAQRLAAVTTSAMLEGFRMELQSTWNVLLEVA